MVRHGEDDRAAFERMRQEARRTRRPLIEIVDEVLDGVG